VFAYEVSSRPVELVRFGAARRSMLTAATRPRWSHDISG
jgi:hypothetical protein